MRVKKFSMDLRFLTEVISRLGDRVHPHYHFYGIPPESTVVAIQIDQLRDCLDIIVHSESFDPVPEGEDIPVGDIVITQIVCPEYQQLVKESL
jgi:hypothetical protein